MGVGSTCRDLKSSYGFWAGSAVFASILLVKYLPNYSVDHSYQRTAAALLLLEGLFYGFYIVVIYHRFFSPLRQLPQPKGTTFFNGHRAIISKEPSGSYLTIRRWINEIPNDGLIRYLNMFNTEHLLVTNQKALAEVLTIKSYDYAKPYLLRAMVGKTLGNGLILAEGDEHKVQRKNLMPALNFRHVKELYPIFWSKSQELVECLETELREKTPNNEVEMFNWASRAALDIIGLAGMGHDFNALSNVKVNHNWRNYRGAFKPSRAAQVFSMLQLLLPEIIVDRLPFKRNKDQFAAARLARETCRKLVQQKKMQIERKEELHHDIISVALESCVFADGNLVDQMMTMLAAGHETSAAALTWTIYLLATHRDVQNRLRLEIRSHIAGLSSPMDSTKLDGLPYLHAICHESLRVYSPLPYTVRDAVKDTTILNQFVPRGTRVVIAPWAINFSKDLWGSDADDFNPDRWMGPDRANSGGANSNYAFMTFLHGPRSCIGQRFAVAELASLVAAFVGRFEFEMVDPEEVVEIRTGIVSTPLNGLSVRLHVLDRWR